MATTTKAHEVAVRKRGKAQRAPTSIAAWTLDAFRYELEASTRVRFPSPRYQRDPVAFFTEILGVQPWAPRQIEILEAVRDHPRVAVSSGHKVGKSNSIAGLALWFFCSFEDARVVLTSTTARQVDQILWRELKMMRARGGRCVACKAEDPTGHRITAPCLHSALIDAVTEGELARTGLKSRDFREVVGFTAREAEAVAGISGKNLLYLPDEASGIPDAIFQAIEGNRAGGARIAMFSNPTKNEGEFFEAFHGKAHLYKTIRISSEETPNVVTGRIVVPGLATREWIEEKRLEWGEDSPLYAVRILGKHATHEEGKIFSIHRISESEQRWYETEASGRLFVGLDPAGPSGAGDESLFAPRRGLKLLGLRPFMGLDAAALKVQLLAMLVEMKLPRETPVVVIDREGEVGSKLYRELAEHLEEHPRAFELVGVRASDGAMRQPLIYDRMRDELTSNLEAWFRDGGAITEDVKLARELHAMSWRQNARGKLKVTPKEELRRALGRSPDRYDALALSVWEPLSLRDGAPTDHVVGSGRRDVSDDVQDEHPTGALDPYAGADPFRGGR